MPVIRSRPARGPRRPGGPANRDLRGRVGRLPGRRRRRTERGRGSPAGGPPACPRTRRGSPEVHASPRSRPARRRSIRGPAARLACVVNSIRRPRTASLTTSRSPHDHAAISTTVTSTSARRGSSSTSECDAASSAARRRTLAVGSRVAAVRSAAVSWPSRSSAPRAAIRTFASELARPAVAVARSDECPAMTTSRRLGPVIAGRSRRDRHVAPHRLSRLVRRTTVHATPNATTVAAMAPVTTASPPLRDGRTHPADGPRPAVEWRRLVVDEDWPPLARPVPAWLSGLRSGRLTPSREDEGTDGEAADPCGLGSEPIDGERESDRHAGADDSGARPGRAARRGPAPVLATPLVGDPDGGGGVRHVRRRRSGRSAAVRARRRRAQRADRRGPADAVRTRAVVGATRRRAGHVRRARRPRRAVPAVGELLLRHRHRARANGPVMARRSRRAGRRVPHRGAEVRLPDTATAPHVRARVDADVGAGRAVRGVEGRRLRRDDRARRRADQRDGVPRRQRRGHGMPGVEPVRRDARPR